MATSKYIYGLSGAGFRVPTNGSATAKQRVKESGAFQVDLDDDKTRKILVGEKDNFIRCAANNSTTATIIGLTRYGFRIKNAAGAYVTVKLGSGVHTVTLTDGVVRRVLRRNYGRYLFSADANQVTIRGIVAQQAGFDIKATSGFKPVTITNANPTNVNDEDQVVVGAVTYAFEAALTETHATNTLTTSGTGAADGDTVVINGRTYTFKTVLTGVANEVLRTGVEDVDLTNLAAAINGTAGAGTTYGTGTVVNADVTCSAVALHAVTLTAKVLGVAGNALTLATTGVVVTRGTATFAGGVDPIANEVKVGGTADASLTNLSEAINGGANVGVDYSTGTVANPAASASAVAAHAITLTALQGGGQTLVVTESTAGARLIVNDATLEEPLVKVYEGVSATVDPQDPKVYTQLRRHFKSYVEA